MTLSKHFDTHGRIKEVQYEIFRSLMYWMTVQYDSMGRVVKRELKIGPYANTTQYRYDYDGDGQLSGVKVNFCLLILSFFPLMFLGKIMPAMLLKAFE